MPSQSERDAREARSARVAAMVRRELGKNPGVSNDALRRKALGLDRGVRRLSPRQFNATYRLPALRSVASVSSVAAAAPAGKSAPKSVSKPAGASAVKPALPTEPSAAAKPARAAETTAPHAEGSTSPAETQAAAPSVAPEPAPSRSKALARPHAAEREAVRGILQLVAREALATEDRASFVRLLDSLDERASVILGLFGRS